MNQLKSTPKRWRLASLVLVPVILLLLVGVAYADSFTVVDDAGADDEPGQKDLNQMFVDYGLPGATAIHVTWNWDDTATSGANTRDGCALFDTNANGFANYALCLTVATDGTYTKSAYECTADSKADRCGGPTLIPPLAYLSTVTASIGLDSDPFGVLGSPDYDANHVTGNTCDTKPACYTDDTVADANIVLADVGGAPTRLINVCSYPSREPNSDPSDCVVRANNGFLKIVKEADPDDGTQEFEFTLNPAAEDGTTVYSIFGAGATTLISAEPRTDYSVTEAVPADWILDTASCTVNGVPTGTPIGDAISGVEVKSGQVTTCTVRNVRLLDFGDAPDTYGTTLANNGARHLACSLTPIFIGVAPDYEADGLPTDGATGDDFNADNDEGTLGSGITLPTSWKDGQQEFGISANAAACLNVWIDATKNDNFTTAGDWIVQNQPVEAGPNSVYFTASGLVGASQNEYYLRFRITPRNQSNECDDAAAYFGASASPVGVATCGEVTDLQVSLSPLEVTSVRLVGLQAAPALGAAMPLAAVGFALLTGFALAWRQRR